MAKTIKFNLILDGESVRNIEELQEHFSIEDMLKYYENGLLVRWLYVRGYKEQYDKVELLDKSLNKQEIVKNLLKIFEVSMDDGFIEKSIEILEYLEKENAQNMIYSKNKYSKNQIINEYHLGYMSLFKHILDNKENISLLKADAFKMEQEYLRLFKLDNYRLFYLLLKNAPKSIFALLTIDCFKQIWLDKKSNEEIYDDIIKLLSPKIAKEILGDDLKVVRRNTQQMWDGIEKSDVKVMVIFIDKNTFVKNQGKFEEKLSYEDVNNKLLIFNGLEYQCNNENYELLYMEV